MNGSDPLIYNRLRTGLDGAYSHESSEVRPSEIAFPEGEAFVAARAAE